MTYTVPMFEHCLYFNTMALSRQLEKIWTQAFRPFDLTPPQAFMLRAVLRKPGMLQSELAETLKIARATATRTLDGLAARGLVERRSTRRDGRECEIHPTSVAMELHAELDAASGAVSQRLREQLGSQEFAGFVEETKLIGTRIA